VGVGLGRLSVLPVQVVGLGVLHHPGHLGDGALVPSGPAELFSIDLRFGETKDIDLDVTNVLRIGLATC
jgi:hypothetical protein